MRRTVASALVALASALAACDPADVPTGEGGGETPRECDTVWHADDDGDGFGDPATAQVACDAPAGHVGDQSDCDDTDAAVSPAATELCNGWDDDCDGIVDRDAEDTVARWADADGDGLGDPDAPAEACPGDPGFVDNADDCDDTDASVGALLWHPDGDGDGYGDGAAAVDQCDAPEGFVRDATDCDDADAGTHPGAEERCDGVDTDCDGDPDAGAVDAATWYVDADGDGWGTSSATVTACAEPSGAAEPTFIEDCDDADASVYPFGAEACFDGRDTDCDGHDNNGCLQTYGMDNAVWRVEGRPARSGVGSSVAILDDQDGDGITEIAFGDAYDDTEATSGGAVFVVAGALSGAATVADARFTASGTSDVGLLGLYAENPGDLNGDGYDDLAVAAFGDGAAAESAGATYVWLGPHTGGALDAAADRALLGASSGDRLGEYLHQPAGDLDGDGLADLLVPGPYSDGHGLPEQGAVYVLFGATTAASVSAGDADVVVHADTAGLDWGSAAAGVGDWDGDGFEDLAVGHPYENSVDGVVHLYQGPFISGEERAGATAADVSLVPSTSGQRCGASVAGLGDTNGDGYPDLLVGCPRDATGTAGGGAVWVVPGGAGRSGTLDLHSAASFHLYGSRQVLYLGDSSTPSAHGDLDGDGLQDLVLGDLAYDGPPVNVGAVFAVWGPMSGSLPDRSADVLIEGDREGARLGADVEVGDVDGDGLDDLLVGSTGPINGTDFGAVSLFLGADVGQD